MTIQVKKWRNPARPSQIRYYISSLKGSGTIKQLERAIGKAEGL